MNSNLLITVDLNYLKKIEWDLILKIITNYAYFDSNKIKLSETHFAGKVENLRSEFLHTEAYIQWIRDEDRQFVRELLLNLPPDGSLQKNITYLTKVGVLNFKQLNQLAQIVELSDSIKNQKYSDSINEFSLINKFDSSTFHQTFLRRFRHLVHIDGEVSYDRDPVLGKLNKRLVEIEEKIRKYIQDWLSDTNHAKIIQYNSYDVLYDRYVVPIRSDSYRGELGLIIGRSETGMTLFVEPYIVRELCNQRLETKAKIDEIINEIQVTFSRILRNFSSLLFELINCIEVIDYFKSKAEFAMDYKLQKPEIRERPGFKFSSVFHPLIPNAISNDVNLDDCHRGIVISGPNTGGKTVFLKSIAISYLLFNHGFFIPAKDAEIFPYHGLYYLGNDQQDLNKGLSSFSGEVKSLIELIQNISATNLIIIDEIFNSTSSDEASALSMSFFDELHKRAQCHIIVSTHHQMFKTFIHKENDYISCNVGFDPVRMRPTYKINWGIPGPSMAIEIFKNIANQFNFDQNISELAKKYLDEKNLNYETLLKKVSDKELILDQLIEKNKKIENDLLNRQKSVEGILHLKINEELNRTRIKIEKLHEEAKSVVNEIRFQENPKIKKVDNIFYNLKNQISELTDEKFLPSKNPETGNLNVSRLKTGDRVFSLVFKNDFTVQEIDTKKNEVTISRGQIKLTVPATSLTYSNAPQAHSKVIISRTKTSESSIEYDTRGMRLSEFQNLLDKALGELLAGDVPYLNIIHGHGDGILKNWLRNFLKKSNDFKIELSETGNDGETRIILK